MGAKVAFLVFLLLSTTVPTCAKQAYTYALQDNKIGDSGKALVWVYNQQTGKMVWSRTVSELTGKAWSKAHRSLVIYVYPGTIILWRAGHRTKTYTLTSDESEDGFLEMVWSPHSRFVSFLNWTSGGETLHCGRLWVLDTWTGRKIHLHNWQAIGEFSWVGERRIIYRTHGFFRMEMKKGGYYPDIRGPYVGLSASSYYFTWR